MYKHSHIPGEELRIIVLIKPYIANAYLGSISFMTFLLKKKKKQIADLLNTENVLILFEHILWMLLFMCYLTAFQTFFFILINKKNKLPIKICTYNTCTKS